MVSYMDADWVGSIYDRRSTSGTNFYLCDCLVSKFSKKQYSISLSTVEEEYISIVACCTQVLWMKQTLQEIQVKCDYPIPIFYENTSVISISKNPVMHSKTKHIPIKFHFMWEQVIEKLIKLEYTRKKEQIAEILKNHLPKDTFEYLGEKLGVTSAPN